MTTIVYLENGLMPHLRKVVQVDSTTIAEAAPVGWVQPYVAFLEGKPILRKDWGMPVPKDGSLAFIDAGCIPQGGGGGGSNPLRIVLMIAVMVAAPYIGTYLAGAMTGTTAAMVTGMGLNGLQVISVFTAAASLVGMALVNAIAPVPGAPSTQAAAAMATPSPTYSLQAQGNSARIDNAIPEHFGRMLCYPDYAAQPYAEYRNNEQYLFQLLCIGRGEYDTEAIKIEDNLLSNFDEATYEVYGPGQKVTLFPAAVSTVPEVTGQELLCGGGTFTRSGSIATISIHSDFGSYAASQRIYLDFTSSTAYSGEYVISGNPTFNVGTAMYTLTVPVSIGLPVSGTVNVQQITGPFIINTVGSTIKEICLDFVAPSGLYYANDDGSLADVSVYVKTVAERLNDLDQVIATIDLSDGIQYTTWSGWMTYTNPALQTTVPFQRKIGRDMYVTSSMVIQDVPVNTNLIEYSRYDSRAAGDNPYVTMAMVSMGIAISKYRIREVFNGANFKAHTNTPQRYTLSCPVPEGRYRVKVRRTSPKATSARYSNTIIWSNARGMHPDNSIDSYGDVTLLAIRIKATNNISQQGARKINLVATRKLPIYNGTSWSANTATRNPIWAVTYMCKQIKLTDAQLDLPSLVTLANTLSNRNDYFDARFDNFVSFWEAISKVCAVARTKPFMQGGIIRLMRDQAVAIPVAMFSNRNIIKGSFAINYILPSIDTCEIVDIKYFDSAKWAPATMTTWVGMPNNKPTSTSAKVDMFGITDRSQALREGVYQAACNKYRRKLIKFQTEMEGFIPSFGDLINIQHDMPGWGQSGEVLSTKVITNLLTNSNTFQPIGGGPVFPTYVVDQVAPDNTTTASRLSIVGSRLFIQYTLANNTFTFSLYVKRVSGTGSITVLLKDNNSDTTRGSATITTTTDWKRVVVTGTTNGASIGTRIELVGAAANDIFWGAQLEVGTSASYYVPTTSIALTATAINISEELTWDTGNHYIALRKRDGSVSGPYLVTKAPTDTKIILSSTALDFTVYTGQNEERTHYNFGWAETYRQPARVLTVKPVSMYTVEIEAVNEDSNVHTAETGVVTPALVYSELANYTNAPIVQSIIISPTYKQRRLINISWQQAAWAQGYIVEYSYDNYTWVKLIDTNGSTSSMVITKGLYVNIRVAAYNLSKGPWCVKSYNITAIGTPTNVSTISLAPSGMAISWDIFDDVDYKGTEVKLGTSWSTATSMYIGREGTTIIPFQPIGTFTLYIKYLDIYGDYSIVEATRSYTVPVVTMTTISRTVVGPKEYLTWDIPTTNVHAPIIKYNIYQGTIYATKTFVATVLSNAYSTKIDYTSSKTYYIEAIDSVNNISVYSSVTGNIVVPGAPVMDSNPTSYTGNSAIIRWLAPLTGTLDISEYDIRTGASYGVSTLVSTSTALSFTLPLDWTPATKNYYIVARDVGNNVGSAFITIPVSILPVDNVSNILSTASSVTIDNISLSWNANTVGNGKLPIKSYEVRSGSTWATASPLAITADSKLDIAITWQSTATFWVQATDINNNISEPTSYISNITAPDITGVPTITPVVGTGNIIITWPPVARTVGGLPIVEYKVKFGDTWDTAKNDLGYTTSGTTVTIPINWLNNRRFWVQAIDSSGAYSVPTNSSVYTVNTHSAPTNFTAIVTQATGLVTLKWDSSTGTLPLSYYTISYAGTVIATTKSLSYTMPLDWPGTTRNFVVTPYDINNNPGTTTTLASGVSYNKLSTVSINKRIVLAKMEVSWTNAIGTLPLKTYEIQVGSATSNWNDLDNIKILTTTTNYRLPIDWIGDKKVFVAGIDSNNIYGIESSTTVTVTKPNAPIIDTISTTVGGTLLDQYRISWTESTITTTNLPIDYYIIGYIDDVSAEPQLSRVSANSYLAKANWLARRVFWVQAVDILGESKGGISDKVYWPLDISAPTLPNLRSEVIDNNVLLYWSGSTGTLPITTFEIAKEPTFNKTATSTYIGEKSGGFTTVFETLAGTYTYYVRAKDSAGNTGVYKSASALVSQPPDYVLNVLWNADLIAGTKVNAVYDTSNNSILMPVDTTETYSAHFTSHGFTTFTSPGSTYPVYVMPAGSTSSYSQVFNYGTLLPSSNISVITNSNIIGSPIIKCTISVGTDGITWPISTVGFTGFASGFQYVKVDIEVTSVGGDDLYSLLDLDVRLDSKNKAESGSFKVYSYDIADPIVTYTQTDTSMTLSKTAHNRTVGEYVSITPTSGNSIVGAYPITSVTANTFNVTTKLLSLNSCTYSEDFTNASWLTDTLNTTVLSNTINSPINTVTADTIVEATTAAGHYRYKYIAKAAGFYTISFYLKRSTRQWGYVQLITDTGAKKITVVIDLSSGSITNTSTVGSPINPTYGVSSIGNGWYRVWVSAYHTNGGNVGIVTGLSNAAVPTYDANILPIYTGSTSESMYVWGAQMEPGAVLGNYTATTTTAISSTTTSGNCTLDIDGTPTPLTAGFLDITSITVSTQGTTPLTTLYNYVDTPNPTMFKALIFNSVSGVRQNGTVSWKAEGY